MIAQETIEKNSRMRRTTLEMMLDARISLNKSISEPWARRASE
jgi:hypothetical protein